MSNPLFDAMFDGHKRRPGPFIRYPDGRTLGSDEFFALTAQLAHVFSATKVSAGDRVLVQCKKSVEAFAIYVACVRIGAVFLPLNTAYTNRELAYFVEDAEPGLIVVDPESEADTKTLVSNSGCAVLTLSHDGGGTLMQQAKEYDSTFNNVERTADDVAAILYTSGTTGRSKGAMLTQKNLLSNALSLIDHWQFTSEDVLLHALPIFHTHGLFVAGNIALMSGCSLIFLPSFNVDDVLQQLPNATTMMGVPTFYTRLLGSPAFTRELAAPLRLFVSGSAPLLAETHIEFESRTGQRILERYGMTETNMITSNPYDAERVAGTVGFALPGVSVRIIDVETNKPISENNVGVLQVRGDNVFNGYWRMPDKTREEFTDDGYFISGDLATVDSNGYISIVGRDKDMIISGGYNVYPKEVELLLDAQDGVLESAVVGAPHPDFGEAVVGFIVKANATDENVTEVELQNALAGDIAKFKQPKRILFIDELPRNTMGKVQKKQLRDQVSELFKQG